MRTVEECFWQESMNSCARSAERKGRAMVERRVRGGENLSKIKLKPCPFCGGEAHIDCFPGLYRPYFPVCNNEMCIACDTIVTFLTEKDAAEAWNRRTDNETD